MYWIFKSIVYRLKEYENTDVLLYTLQLLTILLAAERCWVCLTNCTWIFSKYLNKHITTLHHMPKTQYGTLAYTCNFHKLMQNEGTTIKILINISVPCSQCWTGSNNERLLSLCRVAPHHHLSAREDWSCQTGPVTDNVIYGAIKSINLIPFCASRCVAWC